jgi:hypothetical protein
MIMTKLGYQEEDVNKEAIDEEGEDEEEEELNVSRDDE